MALFQTRAVALLPEFFGVITLRTGTQPACEIDYSRVAREDQALAWELGLGFSRTALSRPTGSPGEVLTPCARWCVLFSGRRFTKTQPRAVEWIRQHKPSDL